MPGNRSVDEPARKIFIKDLDTLDTNRLIWIQGYITDCSQAEPTLFINDGTGGVEVQSYTKAPGDLSWIHKGKYCMVIGFIQRMSHLYIETVKLTDLSRNDIMEFMWEVEVKDMMNLDNLKKGS